MIFGIGPYGLNLIRQLESYFIIIVYLSDLGRKLVLSAGSSLHGGVLRNTAHPYHVVPNSLYVVRLASPLLIE